MDTTIAGLTYTFPQVKKVIDRVFESKSNGAVLLIVGPPGSGKSVFLTQVFDQLNKKIDYLVAVRADLETEPGYCEKVVNQFEKIKSSDEPKVLILDSLDVLACSRAEKLNEWMLCIYRLKKIKNMTIVCASRKFEAEHLYPLNIQNWTEKIELQPLDPTFVQGVFKKLEYEYDKREEFKIPINLKIASKIIEQGSSLKDISVQDLLLRQIEAFSISGAEVLIFTEIAEKMVSNRSTSLSYAAIQPKILEAVSQIKKRSLTSILQVDEKKQQLSFLHQTFIDYFIALKVVRNEESLKDFVLRHKQNLFIRSTIRNILFILRRDSRRRLFKELDEIFFDEHDQKEKIRIHIKNLILSTIASWEKGEIAEGQYLIRLFNHYKDGDQFFIQFFNSQPNADWFPAFKDSLILPSLKIQKEEDLKFRTIVFFLTAITKKYPVEQLDIFQRILEFSPNRILEMYYESLLRKFDEILALEESIRDKYISLFDQAIQKGFLKWDFDILLYCQKISQINPGKALSLYIAEIKKDIALEKDHKSQWSHAYNDIFPLILPKDPLNCLNALTDFFEDFIRSNDERDKDIEKRLYDIPSELLFSDSLTFGFHPFYRWYKGEMLSFCRSTDGTQLIKKLENSKWESQRQLAVLCELETPGKYKSKIKAYLKKLLTSDLKEAYEDAYLILFVLEKGLSSLDENDQHEVINTIMNLPINDGMNVHVWIWKPLHHLPSTLRTEKIEAFLNKLQKDYKFEEKYRYRPPFEVGGFHQVVSPYSADYLAKLTPLKLYDLLIKNRDRKERWDFDENPPKGGVRELAEEVAKVFIPNLEKYRHIIEQLSNDPANDTYLSWLFMQAREKSSPKEIEWIIGLANRLYEREDLHLEIARIIHKFGDVLTPKQVTQLKPAIIHLARSPQPESDYFFEARKKGYSNDALNEGINRTRGVMVEAIVQILNKSKSDWLIELLKELSNDRTISVRAVLLRYLPWAIKPLGWDTAYDLFCNAFSKGESEYKSLPEHFLRYVPKDRFLKITPILEKLKSYPEKDLEKSYAVLIGIFYLRNLIQLDDFLIKISELSEKGKDECFNLLYNQVRFEGFAKQCLKAISTYFERFKKFPGTLSTLFLQARIEDFEHHHKFIEKLLDTPEAANETLFYLFEYLEKCLLIKPLVVFDLLKKILNDEKFDFKTKNRFHPINHSKAPLNIINTALECFPNREHEALALVDRLIEAQWSGVQDYLSAYDRV